MRVRAHRDAELEIDAAAAYFRGEQAGLEDDFVDAVGERLAAFARLPGIARRAPDAPPHVDVRRLRLPRFHYVLILAMESKQSAVLVAVMHEKREPGYWRDRIGT